SGEQRAVGEASQIGVFAAVVGDATTHGHDEAIILAIGVDPQTRVLAVNGGGLILDAEQLHLRLDRDQRRVPDFAGPQLHHIRVAVEDERALAFAGVVGLAPARVEAGVGVQVALDAAYATSGQAARDLRHVGHRQRRIAAAAQHHIAVDATVGVGL